MNRRIIIAGLKARPVRTAVSVLAVALEVTLILSIVGLVTGMVLGTAKHVSEVGADIMLQPPGASPLLGLSNAVLPEKMAVNLAKLEFVQAVAPVIVETSIGTSVEMVWGIEPASFDRITGGFKYLEGGIFHAEDEVIVDDLFAKSKRVRAGDTVEVLNGKYRIAGVVAHGKGSRVFMALAAVQAKKGAVAIDASTGERSGKVSFFFLKLTDLDRYEAVKQKLNEVLAGYIVVNVHEYIGIMSNSLPGLDEFEDVVVVISMCVGVLVIFLSTYTTITERTREIGILRSLGATKGLIVALVIQESLLICAAGALIGTAASFAIARAVQAFFPTQTLEITVNWIVAASLLALLSGILGSIYPAVKAAKQDPIEALAYE